MAIQFNNPSAWLLVLPLRVDDTVFLSLRGSPVGTDVAIQSKVSIRNARTAPINRMNRNIKLDLPR